MAIFLIIQAHSTLYEVGLFSDEQCLGIHKEDKKYSSRSLIPSINDLLQKNNLQLKDLAALGVNQGPGPFTSLRIAITTANGLSFATGVPLIGHNSLEALLLEFSNESWPITIALLNAFNNDLYYALYMPNDLEIGCKNNDLLFALLKDRFKDSSLRFLGNGAALYRNKISDIFDNSFIPDPLPEECSLQQLAIMTKKSYDMNKGLEKFLLPHYLKDIAYSTQI